MLVIHISYFYELRLPSFFPLLYQTSTVLHQRTFNVLPSLTMFLKRLFSLFYQSKALKLSRWRCHLKFSKNVLSSPSIHTHTTTTTHHNCPFKLFFNLSDFFTIIQTLKHNFLNLKLILLKSFLNIVIIYHTSQSFSYLHIIEWTFFIKRS